ncbi:MULTISPECIES: hypothetical protein [Rhodopirellula]|uniref:hypothetical protein n=1 Tax=Rhodopirellula TaxID=265488 RepID=UPI00257C8993|nr:hypothetical protein [Rhodopirellula sp. UBA1907]
MDVNKLRKDKASRAIEVCALRVVLHSKFNQRMFIDLETSPESPHMIWLFVGPECETMTSRQHQEMADVIAESWEKFDGVELIDRHGEVLARSHFDELDKDRRRE